MVRNWYAHAIPAIDDGIYCLVYVLDRKVCVFLSNTDERTTLMAISEVLLST